MKKPKRIALLGATGSIGRNTLEVVTNFPDSFEITYLTANKNIDLLSEQIQQFHPRGVVLQQECEGSVLKKLVNGSCEVMIGEEGLLDIVARQDVDLVVSAMVGFAGLRPTLAAIEAGKDVALANKETLVVAGEIIMASTRKHGVQLLPIDSEHSAILQCLRGEQLHQVSKLILTASGGPFLHLDEDQFETITVSQALQHPTWKMGNKITIDSATLMNKGLEVIEACWLFDLPAEKVEILIHPQSIIHSMVEFIDGSVKAQLGMPDMKLPIQYALMYPERPARSYSELGLSALQTMTFQKPDRDRFRCLDLAYQALAMGGSAPAVLNGANEAAVQLFLEGRLPFASIPTVIEEALSRHSPIHHPSLDDLVDVDSSAREHVYRNAAVNE